MIFKAAKLYLIVKKEACNHQIGVRVTKSKYEEIESIAKAMNISVTEYSRRAIDAQLAYDKENNTADKSQYVTRREVELIVRRILCEEKAEYKKD